jgi:hypothetical protein
MKTRHVVGLAVLICTTFTARAEAQESGLKPYSPDYYGVPNHGDPEAPPPGPKRGDFDFGGQVRLPSGPDEEGAYATFNWIAVDLRGKYYLLDSVSIAANVPIAIIKPDSLFAVEGVSEGVEPKTFGGMTLTLDARLPKLSFIPGAEKTDVGLVLTGGYLTEGAVLLSEKDFPLYVGDYQPALTGGVIAIVRLSSVIDFSLLPLWVYQSGEEESIAGLQMPLALVVKLGDVLKVSADAGVYTGDDYAFSGDEGGRISAGASITLKIGHYAFHAGAGVASLLTGEDTAYPTIGDSVYFDLNVKYVK